MDRNVRYRTDATNTHVGGSMKKDSEISHFVTNRTVGSGLIEGERYSARRRPQRPEHRRVAGARHRAVAAA